jgi:hypothetical protein
MQSCCGSRRMWAERGLILVSLMAFTAHCGWGQGPADLSALSATAEAGSPAIRADLTPATADLQARTFVAARTRAALPRTSASSAFASAAYRTHISSAANSAVTNRNVPGIKNNQPGSNLTSNTYAYPVTSATARTGIGLQQPSVAVPTAAFTGMAPLSSLPLGPILLNSTGRGRSASLHAIGSGITDLRSSSAGERLGSGLGHSFGTESQSASSEQARGGFTHAIGPRAGSSAESRPMTGRPGSAGVMPHALRSEMRRRTPFRMGHSPSGQRNSDLPGLRR